MNRKAFYILALSGVLFACGTEKIVAEETSSISAKDYPYIENFHKALRHKATGRIPESIALLEECLKVRQDDDAVYYALSKAELQLGNTVKSSEYIQKASDIDPDNLWYIQELAYMFFETGEFEKSKVSFKKLVDAEPRNVDWLYGYAEALVRVGEAEKAIEALQKTEDQIGRYPDIIIQKYNLYMSLKQFDEAEQELLGAKEEFPKDPMIIATLVDFYFKQDRQEEAVDMLEELVNADPSNGRAHLTLAEIYRQQGQSEKSYEELKLAFASDDVDIDTKMKILIQIHETTYQIDDEVYEIVDLLIEKHPSEAKAHSIKGDYMLRAKKEDEALAAYKKALEYDKTQYPIWNQVLLMQYQDNQFEDLFKYSTECLDYFPSMSTVYLLKGVAGNQLKKYSDALDALSVGQELVVNDPPLKGEFFGQIAESHFGLKEIQSGIDNFKRAIEISPESALIKNNFAFQLAKANTELELAESMIKQALNVAPAQPQFIDTYGLVYFVKGDFEAASKKFNQAYSIDPLDKLIVEHKGDVAYKLGNTDDALKFWNEALKLSPENELLKRKIADKKYYEK